MQKSSLRVLTAAGLLILALGAYFVLHQTPPSDQEQIVAQMESARHAAEAHDASAMMRVVSADYKGRSDFDSNVDQLHFFLSRVLGRAGKITVTLTPPTVDVQGDTATSTGHLTVRGASDGSLRYDQNITLQWKREDGRRLLIVPARVWRVTGVDIPMPAE